MQTGWRKGRWKLIFTSISHVHSFPDLGALHNKHDTTWLFTTYSSVFRSSTNDKCILTRVWNWSGSSLLSRSAKALSLVVSIDSGTLQVSVLLEVGECTFVRLRIYTHDADYILKENNIYILKVDKHFGVSLNVPRQKKKTSYTNRYKDDVRETPKHIYLKITHHRIL
jgi:hypothetical protein